MVITSEYRTEVERHILEVMASALESSALTEVESGEVARFILNHLDKAETHQELVVFLTQLAERLPIFTHLGNIEMAKAIEAKKGDVTTQMASYLRNGDIQAALDAANVLKTH